VADIPETSKDRRLGALDWKRIGEFVMEELRGRAQRRSDLERRWKEVDRQIRMEPIKRLDKNKKPARGTEWMPLLECPLQAQALEILCADARRLIFPEDQDFFSAHAALEDSYLERLEQDQLTFGVEGSVPTKGDQEGIDALLEGALHHFHRLYDIRGRIDLLNAEAFKYGTFVARGRLATLDKFTTDFRGRAARRQRIPVLAPQSIRNTYLDDAEAAYLHEGLMVAPSFIYSWWHTVDDLMLAAKKGSTNPKNENGGWMPKEMEDIEPVSKDKKSIQLAEMEGDILVPRSQGPSVFLPNSIATVVFGKGGPRVIRYREREFDYRSYLVGHYHREEINSPYGTSPLIKGEPIQKAATEALNRTMAAAILNTEPPISWNPTDPHLQASGGPVIAPGEVWPAHTKPVPIEIGSPDALLRVYLVLLQQYELLTGVNAPRAGAQTKSHQTAFAVDTEQDRGQVRTVDYVRSLMFGPLQSWLHMEHDMLLRTMERQPVYIQKFDGYLDIGKQHLPKVATFDVHGSAGPLEEREKQVRVQAGIATVLQIEQVKAEMAPESRKLDLEKLQILILQDAGLKNAEDLYAATSGTTPAADAGGPGLPAIARLLADNGGNAA
jgi:hypothetical protein